MVDLTPLQAITYQPSLAGAAVFAPPYDVIDAPQLSALRAASPYNVSRLILGPTLDAEGWHGDAAQTMQRWLAQGVLQRSPTVAYYGYQQTFSLPDGRRATRSGLLGRIRLARWGEGIHRHEHTRARAKEDRLRLLRATRCNLSPVFGMVKDPDGALRQGLTPPERPWIDYADDQGVRQVAWAIQDPAQVAAIRRALAEREVVIADGHHRYETALRYRDERRQAEGDPPETRPYDYVLIYLAALEDPGLCILPTHRLLGPEPSIDPAALLRALRADFGLVRCDDVAALQQALSDMRAEGPALGCCLGMAGTWLLTPNDAAALRRRLAQGMPAELADLDVVALQRLILEPHLSISTEDLAHGERVSYTIDAQQAQRAVLEGRAQAAFILNPTTVDQVWQAAIRGVIMPQKSTYFYPKLLSGLVFNPLD
jgi:uncharacterized protein (DUF1015 family)